MIYYVEELDGASINASSPLIALRKLANKIVLNARKKGANIFDIVNEPATLIDLEGKSHKYLFSIVKSNVQKSIYYRRNYEIEVYKHLRKL